MSLIFRSSKVFETLDRLASQRLVETSVPYPMDGMIFRNDLDAIPPTNPNNIMCAEWTFFPDYKVASL
jgi:hypothetical protein